MTPRWRRPFAKRARGADDRSLRHECRGQCDLLARQSSTLPRSMGAGSIRFGRKPSILAEYEEIVTRLAQRYPEKPAVDWLTAIRQAGHLYFPPPLAAATADPDDEMFIECAVAAKADYLVTGDKGHLLVLKHVGGIPIIAATEFLHALSGDSGRAG